MLNFKVVFIFIFFSVLQGCSIEGNVNSTSSFPESSNQNAPNIPNSPVSKDVIYGERIITNQGYILNGQFYQIGQKVTVGGGYTMEAVFSE